MHRWQHWFLTDKCLWETVYFLWQEMSHFWGNFNHQPKDSWLNTIWCGFWTNLVLATTKHVQSKGKIISQRACEFKRHSHTVYSIDLARNGNSGCANEILGCAKCHFWWKSPWKWMNLGNFRVCNWLPCLCKTQVHGWLAKTMVYSYFNRVILLLEWLGSWVDVTWTKVTQTEVY